MMVDLVEFFSTSNAPISADQVLDTLAKAEKRTKAENGAALPATFETVFATAVPVRLKADGGSFRPSALVLLTGFNAGDTPKLIGIYSLDEGPLEGRILQDLRIRGVEGINLFIQENIEGFEADLAKVFPGAAAALSPAALLDWSVRPLTKPEEQRVRPMLTGVLKAETPAAALRLLSNFEITSGVRLAGEIAEGWRNNWERIVPVIETEPARRADVFAAAAAEAAMLEVIHRRLQNGRPFTDAARAVSLVAVCARQALEESAAGART